MTLRMPEYRLWFKHDKSPLFGDWFMLCFSKQHWGRNQEIGREVWERSKRRRFVYALMPRTR